MKGIRRNETAAIETVRKKLLRHGCPAGGRGGGVLGISSDGDDRMEPKVKTQKIPRASSKTHKNPWAKN